MEDADVQLLQDVKAHLNITWEDDATDRKISGIIANGRAYLDDKCGEQADYAVPGYARAMLFEYVRYARDDALDVFESNYLSQLLAMRDQRQVMRYAQKTEQADT